MDSDFQALKDAFVTLRKGTDDIKVESDGGRAFKSGYMMCLDHVDRIIKEIEKFHREFPN